MLTPLEKAVLEMMLDKSGEPLEIIRQQLAYAKVEARKTSGVGFFTDFVIPANAPIRRGQPDMEITDVGAEFSGLKHGAGFVLFIRDGVVSMLEGFTYDEPWPNETDDFKLFRHNVAGPGATSP